MCYGQADDTAILLPMRKEAVEGEEQEKRNYQRRKSKERKNCLVNFLDLRYFQPEDYHVFE